MLLKLKVVEGSSSGKEIIISKEKFLIGRADDCNLRPHSDAISRRHCVIINRGKVVGVRDLKSRNGTLVNGEKITADKRLRNGDSLEVGPLKFEVVLEKTPSEIAAPKKEVAKQSAPASGSSDDMSGMVNAWLEEADGVARDEQRMETREYRFDDTSQIAIDGDKEEGADAEKQTTEITPDEKAEPGKLPKFEVKKEQPKDTQEAAQMVLRKLFNRN